MERDTTIEKLVNQLRIHNWQDASHLFCQLLKGDNQTNLGPAYIGPVGENPFHKFVPLEQKDTSPGMWWVILQKGRFFRGALAAGEKININFTVPDDIIVGTALMRECEVHIVVPPEGLDISVFLLNPITTWLTEPVFEFGKTTVVLFRLHNNEEGPCHIVGNYAYSY